MNTSYNVSPNASDSPAGLIPIGTIHIWPTFVAPDNYLNCDGASYQRAGYPDLFAVLGTTYGSTSSTTFNVPDTRARAIFGATNAGLMGQVGGSGTATLQVSNLPVHGHSITDPAHQHSAVFQGTGFASADGGNGNRCNFPGTTEPAVTGITINNSLQSNGGDVPSSEPINIINPYIILNFVIRAT